MKIIALLDMINEADINNPDIDFVILTDDGEAIEIEKLTIVSPSVFAFNGSKKHSVEVPENVVAEKISSVKNMALDRKLG